MAQDFHKTAKSLQYIIDPAAAGMPLEQYLKQNLHFTKAQIRSMKFRENGLQIDGERVRVNRVLQAGECLEIRLEEEETASDQMEAAPGDLEILYEDNDLIAVWKEAGLVLHPSHGHYQDTLSNRLHGYFQKKNESVMIRSIGRLDRDTAGIVVFAKNQVAAARLWQQKEEGVFVKEYLALCSGEFPEEIHTGQTEETRFVPANMFMGATGDMRCVSGEMLTEQAQNLWYTIDSPIGPMPGELMKMCVTPEGKYAVTHYQVLKKQGAHTLIRARIETGRTHQIRVHMASIGHPLVGDILYGRPEDIQNGPMQLTAWWTRLRQPFTNEWIELSKENRLIIQKS